MTRRTIEVDLNRVEGDLAIEVDVEDGRVVDARCVGTLFRGIEQILVGRAAFDALVIAPRVCGICSTAHLYAAALALEDAWQVEVPPLATLVRDLGLMTEAVQSDLRQSFLFFTVDFVHPRYAGADLADAMREAFAPFTGRMHLETIAQTRKLLEVLALYGGQWPHSSWIVPGGITGRPDALKRVAAESILDAVTRWFEAEVIGGPLDAWRALATEPELDAWLDARPASALALLTRMCRHIGLDRSGTGSAGHLSYGGIFLAEPGGPSGGCVLPPGVYGADGVAAALDPRAISEHVRYAWYADDVEARHPSQGITVPNCPGLGDRYSWVKAPRYAGAAMQTGALSELAVAADPLIRALLARGGDTTWLRQFARLRRVALHLGEMRRQLGRIGAAGNGAFINPVRPDHAADGDGEGKIEAARGALGHWVSIRGGRIERYQIVSPTTWNASPRDATGQRGHWEQTLVGVAVADPDDAIEVGHIVRSHDPCFVCAVHVADIGDARRTRR